MCRLATCSFVHQQPNWEAGLPKLKSFAGKECRPFCVSNANVKNFDV